MNFEYQTVAQTTFPAAGGQSAGGLTDRYQLGELIGEGGMGTVHRAHDRRFDRDVAIKRLKPGVPADSPAANRFRAEARITGQLQHPGIPPAYELGELPTGEPFLAMKLVKGRTLRDLLRKRTGPADDLGRFVAIFEQAAHAVGYAHEHRVIHRDLKPGNIMVGAHGEVQVMDWGLAKALGETADRSAAADPTATTGPQTEIGTPQPGGAVTRTGSVLGTPGYMPAELAGGDVHQMDARSDVFALGAILCEVLTGRGPYEGPDAQALRLQAIRGETAAAMARLDASAAEPELVSLCKRCLALRPADRPADGREVAAAVADMRLAAEARARQAEVDRERAAVRAAEQGKRRRLAVAAAFALVAVLAGGLGLSLWQMKRAIAAETQAKTNETTAVANAATAATNEQRANAERDAKDVALKAEKQARERAFEALRAMTADVVERKFQQGATLTEEDKAFLRGVVAQYDAFAAVQGDDVESRAVRAEGRSRVGRVRSRLGEFRDAEADLDAAVGLYERLAADAPDRPEFRQALANCHHNRAGVRHETGRSGEAEKDFDAAIAIKAKLVAEFPDQPEYRKDLASTRDSRGTLRAVTGRPKEAEADYDAAVGVLRKLADDFPDHAEYRHELAESHGNRGVLRRDTGRPKEAEADYDAAIGLYEGLVADFPARPEYRQDLATNRFNRATLRMDAGRLKEAEADLDAAVVVLTRLAAEFPAQPKFGQDLAAARNSRGLLRRDLDRPGEADQDFDAALALQRRLAADFPDQPDYRCELAGTCVNLAAFRLESGDAAAAKRLLLEGRPHHLAALKANPQHPDYRRFYRNHLSVLTGAHMALLEPADAVRTVQTRRDLGWDPPADAYDAACMLGHGIRFVEKHAKLNDVERKTSVRSYGDEAMKLLRDAVGKGFKDTAHMKKDLDLAPFRGREDFKKVLAELEAKGKP